ncbi:MAG: hypothetical protein K6F61_05665 [Clostridiales bacterium]|nr:hypothetical protein [Clostridiales bacterium]
MDYEAMNCNELKQTIDYVYMSNNNYVLIITLVDGNTICGCLPSRTDNGMNSTKRCYNKNALIIPCGETCECYIPLKEIAGVSLLPYSQKEEDVDPFSMQAFNTIRNKRKSNQGRQSINVRGKLKAERIKTHDYFREQIQADLLDKSKQYGLRIIHRDTNGRFASLHVVSSDDYSHRINALANAQFKFTTTKKLTCGELKAGNNYPIYADWDYISRMSGGIRSIGGGVGFSGSVGWDKTLYGQREKMMDKGATLLENINPSVKDPIVVQTYIEVIHEGKDGRKIPYKIIEGDECIPVLIFVRKVDKWEELKSKEWCVGYLKKRFLGLSVSAFKSINHVIKIQGEVMPISNEISLGKCEYTIMIRNISNK